MSTRLMAQALGRVLGPVALSSLFIMHPAWPYACASVSSIVGMLVLCSLGSTFRKRVADFSDVEPVTTPPAWSDEAFTDQDVEEMGGFLCELLTQNATTGGEGLRQPIVKTFQSVWSSPF